MWTFLYLYSLILTDKSALRLKETQKSYWKSVLAQNWPHHIEALTRLRIGLVFFIQKKSSVHYLQIRVIGLGVRDVGQYASTTAEVVLLWFVGWTEKCCRYWVEENSLFYLYPLLSIICLLEFSLHVVHVLQPCHCSSNQNCIFLVSSDL